MLEVHVLASGSDGNCIVVRTEEGSFMVDAGLNGKQLTGLMGKVGVEGGDISAILLSHEHVDHVRGAGVLSRKYGIPVMGNSHTLSRSDIGKVDYQHFKTMMPFKLAGMEVSPLPTSHDALEPNAFLIRDRDHSLLIATDTGVMTAPVEEALKEVDLAIIESNYDEKMLIDGPYPIYLKRRIASECGHLSNIDCGISLRNTMGNGRRIFLAHLSKNNNTPDSARDTVARITGIKRMNIDCLEFPGDYRTLRVL